MDKISIVVPCYNMQDKVRKCINSIKKQSYKNIEVILVDDGSKDKTKDVIKENIKDDKRFKYYYKKNGGISSARNYGIKKVTGKYICFIDSDDYIEKKYIEKLYNSLINENSDISICYFSRKYENFTNLNVVENGFNNLLKHPAVWNKLYKTDLFIKNNILFPEGKWYEDLGTFSKILMISSKISIVEESLYNYIQNPNSIMHTYDNRIYQIYDIVEDIEDFAKKNKLFNKYYKDIEFIHLYHILVGTIYRSSFMKNFSKKHIKDIVNYVEQKYPKWFKNKYINDLSLIFKIYLFLVKNHCYNILFILLKLFNKNIKL